MALSDTAIRNTKGTDKPQKLADSEGLYLYISASGGKLWRMDYRFAGKRKTVSFGKYPAVSLKDARGRRDQAKELLANGVDPSAQKQVEKNVIIATELRNRNTFEAIALEWFSAYSPDLSPKHALKLSRYLEKVLFPAFGDTIINELTPADILNIARPAQEKGRIQTAHRLVQLAGQVLQYAIIKGLLTSNVASGITRALQPIRATSYPAITEPKEIGRLLRAIDNYEGFPSIVYFLRILPYIFTRPGELRLAEWVDVDFDNALLTIPWQRMKTRKINPKNHLVPLAPQVITLFHEIKDFSGHGQFIFPSARAKTDTISDAGPLNALRDLGYAKEVMTLHGFRSMASTRLNEMGYRPDIIETQLAHKDPDTVRMIYNRAAYMDERRKMMQEWADYLDNLSGE